MYQRVRHVCLAAAMLGITARAGFAQEQQIWIGSFTSSKSDLPFTSAAYSRLRTSLTDAVNFGPEGIVPCPVSIKTGTGGGVGSVLADYLADKDVFFTSRLSTQLNEDEKTAISNFVAGGGVLIVDADQDPAYPPRVSSLLAAIGTSAEIEPNTTDCGNGANVGDIDSSDNAVINGPFGDVRGLHFGTTPSAKVNLGGGQSLVTCNGTSVRGWFPRGSISDFSGLVMFGGDPSAINLFTVPDPFLSYYNANNEIMYLNAIADACPETELEIAIDIKPGSDTNPVNVWSLGVIPVAILGSAEFDVTTVDLTTLNFAGTSPAHAELGHFDHVNGDGYPDLVSHYWVQDTALSGTDTEACVSGSTLNGSAFTGCDVIDIVGW